MSVTLAPLRQDLQLHASHPEACGAPAWVIQDPITNRFYRIGWLEYECLLRWPTTAASASAAAIIADINQHTALNVDEQNLEQVAAFLADNYLLRPSPEVISRIKQQAHRKTWRDWRWWLRNYLFIRLPLVRPDIFLKALLPWFRPLLTPLAGVLISLITVTGLLLIIRQWDQFSHGLLDVFTLSGLVGFALALIISKMLHELGHALVATHFGLRVAHIGVAFLVMWPMLYTDTGESWRLPNSRQRLAISVAGIGVELALAGIASLLWWVIPRAVPISAPVLAYAKHQQFVYAPFAAQVVEQAALGEIAAGQTLVKLTSPDLSAQAKVAKAWQDTLSGRLAGLMADEQGQSSNLVVVQRAYEQAAEYDALLAEQQRLHILAEFTGIWLDLDSSVQQGSWLNEKQAIGVLIDPEVWVLDAYLTQQEIQRISLGAKATFYANGRWQGQVAMVESIDEVRLQRSVPVALDADHGGRIMTFQQPLDQKKLPIASRYRVRLALQDAPNAPYQEQSGYVQIAAERQSQLWQGAKWLMSVLIRESGF